MIDCFPQDVDLVIEELVFRSIGQSIGMKAVKPVIAKTSKTLKRLTLGREWDVYVDCVANGAVQLTGDEHHMLNGFSLDVKLELEHLGLLGLEIPSGSSSLPGTAVHLPTLKSLTLESCEEYGHLLKLLSTANHMSDETQHVHLLEFILRAEKSPPSTLQELSTFLGSFKGLRKLSVLIDNTPSMPNVDCFLATHADSLRCLVWAGRQGPRDHSRSPPYDLYLGHPGDDKSELGKILSKCNLESLVSTTIG